ncbi:MAG: hypothetical protein MUP16_11155 [Sedimentisphaerales bacterium]|nr:hypothetical protein [Sedimentisphaerales bacterium]
MTENISYNEKFKDPRWQKRRLEILNRDEWMCQICGDNESTLHVHHRWYENGKDPWDYTDECLVTLCEKCHEIETRDMPNVCASLIYALKHNFFSAEILDIADGLNNMPIVHVPEVQARALNWILQSDIFLSKLIETYFEHMEKMRAKKIKQGSNNDAKEATEICKS